MQREVDGLRKSVAHIKKALAKVPKHPIIIERLDENMLTAKEKRALKEALADLKAGRKNSFFTISELRASL
jgi:transcriptional regulator CtsR